VILIVTDDQRWDSLWAMPNVRRLLAGNGVTFTNAFVTTSYCCPSRASILTGQYSRHTGVLSDSPPDGGAPVFRDRSTLATWLHAAGYQTALIGKYLNAYRPAEGVVPPGWSQWDAIEDVTPGVHYYDYTLDQDGRSVPYGSEAADYSTTVLSALADRFLRRATAPFFLYLAPSAPHAPAKSAPGDPVTVAAPPLTSPSFNEPDVSDKPWGSRVRSMSTKGIRDLRSLRGKMLASLLGVDRAIASMVAVLSRRGQLKNTVIVFTSDNGYLWGEHRLLRKIWPYEESIRVPLVVMVPWLAGGRTDPHLALNIDLAPTIARLAHVTPGLKADGRSLVPLLEGAPAPSRRAFVVEYLGHEYTAPGPPRFEAIRTERYLYVEYENGWRELYDLAGDPLELSNLAGLPAVAALQARLAKQLRALLRG
jgi:arylsulfatase A-like enzyme